MKSMQRQHSVPWGNITSSLLSCNFKFPGLLEILTVSMHKKMTWLVERTAGEQQTTIPLQGWFSTNLLENNVSEKPWHICNYYLTWVVWTWVGRVRRGDGAPPPPPPNVTQMNPFPHPPPSPKKKLPKTTISATCVIILKWANLTDTFVEKIHVCFCVVTEFAAWFACGYTWW